MSPYLSLIIPAYNEAAAIQSGKLDRLKLWLQDQPYQGEIIVVDDGSLDDTACLAKEITDHVLTIPHAGKAAAIVAGIHAASGEVVLFTDMDQATPISEAPRLLEAVKPGVIAIGSRGMSRQGAPVWRYLLSWSQVALRTLLIGLKITDTQCGFKAFPRLAALAILEKMKIYHPSRLSGIQGPSVTSGFDVEFLFVGQRLGYKIKEVPVIWNYQETRRVRLVRDAWRGLSDLLHITLADLKGVYPRRAA